VRQPEKANYKPMAAILSDDCTVEDKHDKWEYEWNVEQKLWIAQKAP
jgi:hypothetical protein